MAPIALGGWVPRRVAAHPGGWALAVALVASWPLLDLLAPLGAAPAGTHPPAEGLVDLAFLAGLVGVGLALGILGRSAAFLELLPGRSRVTGEAVALTVPGVLAQALVLIGGLRVFPAAALPGLLVSVAHLAALGLLVLRIPRVAASVRIGLFLLLAWLTPALLLDPAGAGAWLLPFLDASRHVDYGLTWTGLAPPATLLLAAIQLGTR